MRASWIFVTALAISAPVQSKSIFDALNDITNSVENLGKGGGSTSSRASSSPAIPLYDIGSFDVVGVSLGMTPSEARIAMLDRGFSVTERPFQASSTYEALVAKEAKRLRQSAPQVSKTVGPDQLAGKDSMGNRVLVKMIATRNGPVVAEVDLIFDENTNSISTIKEDIIRRYGEPSRSFIGSLGLHWCNIGATTCDLNSDRDSPKLVYSPSILYKLRLTSWLTTKRSRDAEIAGLFAAPDGSRQKSLIGGF